MKRKQRLQSLLMALRVREAMNQSRVMELYFDTLWEAIEPKLKASTPKEMPAEFWGHLKKVFRCFYNSGAMALFEHQIHFLAILPDGQSDAFLQKIHDELTRYFNQDANKDFKFPTDPSKN